MVYNVGVKVDRNKLKVSGMIAAVIAVVGVTFIIANSGIGGGGLAGVSADVQDLATGAVVVMSRETYQDALARLNSYFDKDQAAQDKIVADVVKMLRDVVK